jgi:hypothetical protein
MHPADLKALDTAVGEMVRTDEWQALLKERGWVDMYQPRKSSPRSSRRSARGSKASCGTSG